MARKKHVMVVNDHPEFLALLSEFLNEEGYEVSALPKQIVGHFFALQGEKMTYKSKEVPNWL